MLRDIISLSHSRCSRDITIQIFEGIQVGEIHFDQNYDGYSSPSFDSRAITPRIPDFRGPQETILRD